MYYKNKVLFIITFLFFNVLLFGQSHSLLIDLIEKEHYEKAKTLIKNKQFINKRDANGATPFMWAIYKNQLDIVKLLKKNGARVHLKGIINHEYIDGDLIIGSPLTVAALNGDFEVVKFLISDCGILANDKEIDSNGDDGWNALFYLAYRRDFKEIADFLIEKGAEINLTDANGRTPLYYAFDQEYLFGTDHYIKYLLNKGATCGFIDFYDRSPAGFAIYCNQQDQAKKILKGQIELINQDDKPLANPLVVAIIQEDEAMIKWLLDNGADKKIALKFVSTIFDEADSQENYGAYRLLNTYVLDGKLANKDFILSQGFNDLLKKIEKPEIFRMLLNNGLTVSPNGKELYSKYLAFAPINHKIRILSEDYNVKINADTLSDNLIDRTIQSRKFNHKVFNHITKGLKNNSPVYGQLLESTIRHNNDLAFNLILDKNADLNIKLGNNSNILWEAYKLNNLYMFKRLIDNGADLNYRFNNEETILHRMSKSRRCHYNAFIEIALEKGANINAVNIDGDTALNLSTELCIDDILIAHKANYTIKNKKNETVFDDIYYYSHLFNYADDKNQLADLFTASLNHFFSHNGVDFSHLLKYLLNEGVNLKDAKTVEQINSTIVALAKSSAHFNKFNALKQVLEDYDTSYKFPDIDPFLIDKLTKSSNISKAITEAIIDDNLSDFKEELEDSDLYNGRSRKDALLVFLTIAAQSDSKEIVMYILKQGINPLNRKIVPYSSSSYDHIDAVQTLVDKKNKEAINYILSKDDTTGSYEILKNYAILCDLKDEQLIKNYLDKKLKQEPSLKKVLSYTDNQKKLNSPAIKNNLFGVVKHLADLKMNVSSAVTKSIVGNRQLNEILIIEEKIDFIKFYIEQSEKEEFLFIIEEKLEYIIQKNKTKLIDLFAPYILEKKEALYLYYNLCLKYDNTYAMDAMLKLHPKEKASGLKAHIRKAIETRNHNFIAIYYNNGFDMDMKFHVARDGYDDNQGMIEYAINYDAADMVDFLIECDVTINEPEKNNDSPIEHAAYNYNLHLLESVLNTGINPDIINDYFGLPWAQLYLNKGFYEGFELFWKRNINPNLMDLDKNNLLHCMVYNDYDFTANSLNILEKISNINATNKDGETALLMACKSGNLNIVKALLLKNADVNIGNTKNVTPIMMAAYTDNQKVFKLLIEAHANKNAKDNIGRNALDYANMGNATRIITLLKK